MIIELIATTDEKNLLVRLPNNKVVSPKKTPTKVPPEKTVEEVGEVRKPIHLWSLMIFDMDFSAP